jgi:hypothetical protein
MAIAGFTPTFTVTDAASLKAWADNTPGNDYTLWTLPRLVDTIKRLALS